MARVLDTDFRRQDYGDHDPMARLDDCCVGVLARRFA